MADSRALAAILGLAPTLIGTGIKWLQDNSKTKRRSELAERLTAMSKIYGEQNPGTDEVLLAVHAAVGNEIHAIVKELSGLQAESKRSSRRTFYGLLSDLLLLFRPHGVLAWIVHIAFYSGVALVLLALLGFSASPPDPDNKYGFAALCLFGLLLFGLQRWASRLHSHI